MALRIGGGGAPAGVSTPMQQPEVQLPDPDQAVSPSDPDGDGDNDSDSPKIPQVNAGYQGPENGPFICANCIFFDNGSCEVVDGAVDHLGCCNNFTSMAGQGGSGDGGNTIGDQSNGAQSTTDDATSAQPSSDTSGY